MTSIKNMVVGLTGGMGSGKSIVCRIFSLLGVPTYDCDAKAKELMSEDAGLALRIKEAFGKEAYSGRVLNREYLAAKVFNDKKALDTLNALVHPAVTADMREWLGKVESPAGYAVVESAILFDHGLANEMDYTVTVSAPVSLRIERVVTRDGMERDKVEARLANQMSDGEREKLADFVIKNDECNLVWKQTLALDKHIRHEIQSRK